jgi:hypothetical protein
MRSFSQGHVVEALGYEARVHAGRIRRRRRGHRLKREAGAFLAGGKIVGEHQVVVLRAVVIVLVVSDLRRQHAAFWVAHLHVIHA